MDCSFGSYKSTCNIIFMSNYEQTSIPKLNFAESSNYNGTIKFPRNNIESLKGCISYCNNYNRKVTVPGCVKTSDSLLANCPNFNKKVILEDGVETCNSILRNCSNFNRPIYFPLSIDYASSALYNCSNFNSPVTFDEDGFLLGATYMLAYTKFNQNIWIPEASYWESLGNFFKDCPFKKTANVYNTAVEAIDSTNTQVIRRTHASVTNMRTGDVTGLGINASLDTLGCKVIDRERSATFEVVMDDSYPVWVCTRPGNIPRI